ncbi:MAG: peptidoglycan DD-metalloendopeptidase family protein [Actinomycetota bacterium]
MRFRVRIPFRPFLSVLLAVTMLTGSAVAWADTEDELDAAEARLEDIRQQIADEESALSSLQVELNEIAGRLEAANSRIEQTRQEITETELRIAATERRYEALRTQLSDRATQAFMAGGPGEGLELLLDASSMADLSDRIEFMGAVAQADAALANDVSNAAYELEISRRELEAQLDEEQSTLAGLQTDQAELESKFDEQAARIASVLGLRADASDLIDELEEQLQRELTPPPPPSSGGGEGDGIPGPLEVCPVAGPHAYADTFGQIHVHPGWTHAHQGNDISAPYGTPIVAPFPGTAVADTDDTAGNYVTVTGAGGFVQMLHMSRFGTTGRVATGDVVGYVGDTGLAEGPHTHFEWHPGGGSAADPYPQLNEVC